MKLMRHALCSLALVTLVAAAVGCSSTPAAPELEQQVVAPPPLPTQARPATSETTDEGGGDCELQDTLEGITAASCGAGGWEPCVWTGPAFNDCGAEGWYHCGTYHYCYTLVCPPGGPRRFREGC